MALSTEWSRALSMTAPIVNAPMGGTAGGALATAVSRAGGLGMVGMGSTGSASKLTEQLAFFAGLNRPFGIGLVEVSMARDPLLLSTAIAANPALISVSFASTWEWVAQVHDAGIATATQIADLHEAQRAQAAGVDVLVARGAEGGGHGEPQIGTLPLLTAVLDGVEIPVLAAGGISSGRGLAAVLAAGASGAWLGTAFAACTESLSSETTRQALLAARETDTMLTREFDIADGYTWPSHLPERVLRNEITSINAGQGVGGLTAVHSAAEVVQRLCAEAAEMLSRWS
ncbi:NAD(P)H-dependent flavin oxidoreductase [Mycolicibacterium komossense]|uniref:NAD(P)H-dependent flavin oxidoreductase n=1 Tax=Mycolicibacterium komossense TaxID=1779 RepID=UPI0021F3BAAB|nr:nitronate monooxygenase [Mycolicibacterium komossense]